MDKFEHEFWLTILKEHIQKLDNYFNLYHDNYVKFTKPLLIQANSFSEDCLYVEKI